MSGGLEGEVDRLARACRGGRFIPHFRNRPAGQETLEIVAEDDCLMLSIMTELEIPGHPMRQLVTARFDRSLRPRGCMLFSGTDPWNLQLDLVVDGRRAVTRYRNENGRRMETSVLARTPLLLIDNCFASHALAGLVVQSLRPREEIYESIPAFQKLRVTTPGTADVLLGGEGYYAPHATMHLAPGVDEHVWIGNHWVDRLIIPGMHLRVDWVRDGGVEGGVT